jgi:glutamate synthase domain-containing protein 2
MTLETPERNAARGSAAALAGVAPRATPVTVPPADTTNALFGAVRDWEDVLVLVVDPEAPRVADRERKRRFLSFLLERAGLNEAEFWRMSRGQRGRRFLASYSRVSRAIPALEITSFDVDKLLKERFRHEPLTLGAAWHFGFWRSYFSQAAITHPANDGLREEFSTAWDLARREAAVLFRTADGARLLPMRRLQISMPMLVGPLPHSDGRTLELAYLRAAAAADAAQEKKTRTLVVVRARDLRRHLDAYLPHADWILPRLSTADVGSLGGDPLGRLIERVRIVEIEWDADAPAVIAALRERAPELLISVFLRKGAGFWDDIEAAVRTEGVAMVQVHSGAERSYRLVPEVDRRLKRKLLRARVQLVSAGGDSDTHASAAAAYEAVLLGANGAAMTHVASLALVPELVDVYHGDDPRPLVDGLAARDPEELREHAENTLSCWQHSILDFLSCMGIDDVQKTSGNDMAITMTEDWLDETARLATPDFARRNEELNRRRIAAEPVPRDVAERFRPSALLREVAADRGLSLAARILAQESVSWHLANTNRSLTADFLEVIYRMSAGEPPTADDFFLAGDLGPGSIDSVGVKLSRESLEWSVERLRRDPALLDYVSLAVPRGFLRPGAAPPGARCELRAGGEVVATFTAGPEGDFDVALPDLAPPDGAAAPWSLHAQDPTGGAVVDLALHAPGDPDCGGHGRAVVAASKDSNAVLKRDPRGGLRLSGFGVRRPVWHGPVGHASISLGAASEDFLVARIKGSAGLAFTSSGEGGPLRLESDDEMAWESLQAASGHFGLTAGDLRRVRDVEIKINQGAKPGKGGRLSGAKVTPQVSRARNIPVGTDALSPDPKHDIYSIEDMPAEVWLWLLYHNYCGIKICGSTYTRYVAAGMWSNFVVDYLLIDSGMGGSGNYHADSSHVGWPDVFRTILHTHHALVHERVDLDGTGELRSIRDANGVPFGAQGGTRLFASGGLRGELDMLKVLIAGADGVVEASIGKAVAFGCNQCGNCHLDCPRGGITTKPELTAQNDVTLMSQRVRNWTALNLVKLAVLIDALNRESGALAADGRVADAERMITDVRALRGRVDLLAMPPRRRPAVEKVETEHDSCRVGSLCVSVPVTVHAIWEGAKHSHNGGNNRGGGLDFAGFAPPALREKTALFFNTIGPDRAETMARMLAHLGACDLFDARGRALAHDDVLRDLERFRVPVRPAYAAEGGWRASGLREDPGDYYHFYAELKPDVLVRYGRRLVASEHWLQRRTKYGDLSDEELLDALDGRIDADPPARRTRLEELRIEVKEEWFTALAHLLDTRYYRTHVADPILGGEPAPGKFAAKRSGYVVSMGEDLGAIKVAGWTHLIPEYFDFERFWARYPGAEDGGVEVRGRALVTPELYAHVWGLHHRYPTNSPAIDAEGRGNPAGAHPFKSYNVLLMHNGEQVGVDSTAPFLCEYGYVHADASMGDGAADYEGDSYYERKALTDTEYAAYLFDFTRRILGLDTEEASQVISPITGIDLASMDDARREKLELLMRNYVQLTPTGPYKFTVLQSQWKHGERIVGFRENMDIKFLRPHEIVSHKDLLPGGVEAVANGSEAKIADSMLRVLHQRGVLKDPACDLRFNMRAGGRPRYEEHGGVFEAFVMPDQLELTLVNRFGEAVPVKRAGRRVNLGVPLRETERLADRGWMHLVDGLVEGMVSAAVPAEARRIFGPEDELPPEVTGLVQAVLQSASSISFQDFRYLSEIALPRAARRGDSERALALRALTELRKRLQFADLGDKALSSMEYVVDGGRTAGGAPEGGIYRILDDVPALADAWGASRYLRIDADTRHDLAPPSDPARDVLVVNMKGLESESFTLTSASRFFSECVRAGWRNMVGYEAIGGPRYVGTNLAAASGASAAGVTIELYGREHGDFVGALCEGARIYVYGQAQSHVGFKADSGYLFVLQDALNTCMYAAHGGTLSVWDSGSRFAVAGQNKVHLADGVTLAPGFKSIHFGNPNEYAFEYLMSGGENSLHVVLGLKKPGLDGELSLRPKPYMGKFLMSGAAAGRVVLLDPDRTLEPAQHAGNAAVPISVGEWERDVAPFLQDEADRRGLPLRIQGETVSLRLERRWRSWRYDEAFVKLVPQKTAWALEAARLAETGARS